MLHFEHESKAQLKQLFPKRMFLILIIIEGILLCDDLISDKNLSTQLSLFGFTNSLVYSTAV
jgi:hypothetical protein